MPSPTVFANDTVFNAGVSFSSAPTFPDGSITSANIASLANIDASKLQSHRSECRELAAINVEPVSTPSTYVVIHVAQAAGGSLGFVGQITGVLPATTGVVSLDLFRSTAGSTFVSILSAPILLGSDNTVRVSESGTIATSTIASGDVFAYKMAVGSTSAARGVSLAYKYWEKYV